MSKKAAKHFKPIQISEDITYKLASGRIVCPLIVNGEFSVFDCQTGNIEKADLDNMVMAFNNGEIEELHASKQAK